MVRDFRATAPVNAKAGITEFRQRFGREPGLVFVSQRDTTADCLEAVDGVEVRHVPWIQPWSVYVVESSTPPPAPPHFQVRKMERGE